MGRKSVWVLGSANIDTTYRLCELPGEGDTLTAVSCKTATGGKGANQAYAAKHCGASVSFIGAVGKDAMGGKLLETMRLQGIATEYVTETDTESGNAVIFVDDRGANCIVVYPGANREIPAGLDVDFKQRDVVAAQLEINIDAVEAYFAAAKQSGAVTVLNPSPYRDIPKNIIDNTDMIIANEHEAGVLGGVEITDMDSVKKCAGSILSLGIKAITITLGKNGAYLKTADEEYIADGHAVIAVDTQGAGDAFLGSFISKLSEGCGYAEALEFANAVGAMAVTVHGSTQVSMPDLGKVKDMIAQRINTKHLL